MSFKVEHLIANTILFRVSAMVTAVLKMVAAPSAWVLGLNPNPSIAAISHSKKRLLIFLNHFLLHTHDLANPFPHPILQSCTHSTSVLHINVYGRFHLTKVPESLFRSLCLQKAPLVTNAHTCRDSSLLPQCLPAL